MRVQLLERMLKNKFYADILVNPWSGEKYHELHTAMISLQEYNQIQRVKSGFSNHANRPHTLLHPDFPLRRFVSCVCAEKLTAGWSKGRHKKYAYYLCNAESCCHYGLSVPRKELHDSFVALLQTITPKESFLKLFETSFVEVWDNRQSYFEMERMRLEREFKKLETRKQQLLEMRMNNEISKDEYINFRNTLDHQMGVLHGSRDEIEIDELDDRPNVSRAIQLIQDIAQVWRDPHNSQVYRLQKLVFPQGIAYDRAAKRFRTAVLAPIFELNDNFNGTKSDLVAEVGKKLNRIWESVKQLAEFWRDAYDSEELDEAA